MTDIILILCTTLGGFLVGKHICNQQKALAVFFVDFQKYANLLKSNIQSRQLELGQFDSQFCSCCSEQFANYVKHGKLDIKMAKGQHKLLDDFFSCLSHSNFDELFNNLAYYIPLISSEATSIFAKEKSCKAYQKLGALCGVMLGILFL